MDPSFRHRQLPGRQARGGCLWYAVVVVVLFIALRWLCTWAIDYQWWNEIGQLHTWFSILGYSVIPVTGATIIAFVIFWIAHSLALKRARVRLREHSLYAKLSALGILLLAWLVSASTLDTWTVVRYFGGRDLGGAATAWHDPVFGNPLAFYLFKIPFYSDLLGLLLGIVVLGALIYWIAERGWELSSRVGDWQNVQEINIAHLGLADALSSNFVRGLGAIFLIALAARFFLGRYGLLLNEHGSFMVGVDYVDQNIALPLIWLEIAASIAAAGLLLAARWRTALIVVIAAIALRSVIPPIIAGVYVRPNEISIERPYIQKHIEATRSAYGIDQRTREVEFSAQPNEPVDFSQHQPLLDNVRLWDWHAYHDAITQLQPYRPYTYSLPDIDRYTINGQLRQMMLSARELDLTQLGEAGTRWINPHFIYTHGYGVVMAEANRVSPQGLPELIVRDAPPVVSVPNLKLTQPDLYYGENVQDPVFVHTAQPEFDYPSGDRNVETHYQGKGGFPISSLLLRTAAAVSREDVNILLTGYLTQDSRMMIRRNVTERVSAMADFLSWDPDPYLVLTDSGRPVWIIDGYMTSDVHPYSARVAVQGMGEFNYIRNSVKATVDAYDGTVHFYVFDPDDPLLEAYRNLFPSLFDAASAMPADLRRHVRYPEVIFSVQADIYRLFHMRDPDTFYNKSDAWDTAKFTNEQGGMPGPLAPTYVVATLPGETTPEFLLLIPFTPRNRDNLIGLMMARCDGEHLGEKVVLLLSKQEIILGPMQIEARINQDQNISKDLTLWNQQGSQVLRGQILVLPIDHTFLYVEPIYIQASQAKMPQLKKVALAMGNNLVYSDTYPQALAQLAGQKLPTPDDQSTAPASTTSARAPAPASTATPAAPDARIMQIRDHLQRYRQLVSEGKLSEAGKELEAIQSLVAK
ncbi:MAG TPA: UPF0182 family protein [Bryobacteraceae bacterium]|nr:UPF0182 family protein [Bryobacteraceae bacterium]